MPTLESFAQEYVWKNNTVYKKETGRKANLKKEHETYLGSIDSPEDFLTVTAFEKEVTTIAKSHHDLAMQEGIPQMVYPTVDTVGELVTQAFERFNIELDAKGESITVHGQPTDIKQVQVMIKKHMIDYQEETPTNPNTGKPVRKGFKETSLVTELDYLILAKSHECLADLKSLLEHDPSLDIDIDKNLRNLWKIFKPKEDLDLIVAFTKHYIWQIKRYVFGYAVHSPYFLNIYGTKQHTGKTFLMDFLTSPVSQFSESATLDQVLDERLSYYFYKNFVVKFDELSLNSITGEGKMGLIASFKKLLTATDINHRVLGTHNSTKASRTFSGISTSNLPLTSVIYDPTGMRRFFQIEFQCDKRGAQERVDRIKENIDILKIYQAIDETDSHGFIRSDSPIQKALVEVQNTYKARDLLDVLLESMLESHSLVPIPTIGYEKTVEKIMATLEKGHTIHDIFSTFSIDIFSEAQLRKEISQWAKEFGYSQELRYLPSPQTMLRRLSNKGFVVKKVKGLEKVFVASADDLPDLPEKIGEAGVING